MAVKATTYGTLAGVEERVGWLVGGRTFENDTVPSSTDVERALDQIAAEIHAYRELIPWVQKKLHVDVVQAPSVAFLVARKISKVGTKANPYHQRVYDRNVEEGCQ